MTVATPNTLNRFLILVAAGCAGLSLASAAPLAQAAPADLVLVNGRILTMDAAGHAASALAVRDGRIVGVGSSAAIRRLAGPRTRVIDLQGRTATPGLIDTHAHLAEGGAELATSIDLAQAASIGDIRRLVAEKAATLRPGEWVLGHGWDEGKLAERRLVLASDLDAAAPNNPVWILHTTGHYGTANSAALRLAKLSASTPNPVAGTIQRAADGSLTGVLMEAAAMAPIDAVLPPLTAAQRRAGILAALDIMHREGMTAVKDPDISTAQWDAYLGLAREGRLTAHVCVLWHTDPSLESVRDNIQRLATLPRPPAVSAPNLVSCGVKIFMDGSGGARTAWMYDEWNRNRTEVDAGNRGFPLIDPALYREAVSLYTRAGIHVATHAIGDRAIDWVVDAYAQSLAEADAHGLRHAIIHANTPTDHAMEVMAALQRDRDAGYPETQGGFAWWIGDNYAGNLGPERSLRLNPYHSYRARGIRWGGGSDFSVTPLAARYGLWASVAREPLKGTYGREPFGTAEAADVDSALRSYTVWAAHQLFLDADAGTLEVGKSADVAVWDRDPTSVPTPALRDMKCELTLFRGQVVYRADGSPVIVPPAPKTARASRNAG